MAQLRLIGLVALIELVALISLFALEGCRQTAEAEPGSGIAAPIGWRALPELAAAVRTAAGTDRVGVDRSEAWGEPAMGCYGAWLSIHGSRTPPDVMAQQILEGLATEPELAGIAIRDVVKPAVDADRGTLSLAFTRATYHGRLRAQLEASGQITALACFWNEREPGACESSCTGLLGRLP